MNSTDLRRFIQKVHCNMDYFTFVEVYGDQSIDTLPDHRKVYLELKWKKFKENWSTWFCGLDDQHAERFIKLVEGK